jgi:hypothetical protein
MVQKNKIAFRVRDLEKKKEPLYGRFLRDIFLFCFTLPGVSEVNSIPTHRNNSEKPAIP